MKQFGSDNQVLFNTAKELRDIARSVSDRKLAAKINAVTTDLEVSAVAEELGHERHAVFSPAGIREH
jgi:hypothetical protein